MKAPLFPVLMVCLATLSCTPGGRVDIEEEQAAEDFD